MTYEILRGIPLPSAQSKNEKYPFKKMEVGEMFYADIAKKKTLQNLASRHGKSLGRVFRTREKEGRVGVWRVA